MTASVGEDTIVRCHRCIMYMYTKIIEPCAIGDEIFGIELLGVTKMFRCIP